jgi:diguanylate cyclase (GGDEF)-like protein
VPDPDFDALVAERVRGYNRRHFLHSLDAEWSRFQRDYRSVSVLMLDIDHFKSVNDRYGHAVRDAAINRSVAWLSPPLANKAAE